MSSILLLLLLEAFKVSELTVFLKNVSKKALVFFFMKKKLYHLNNLFQNILYQINFDLCQNICMIFAIHAKKNHDMFTRKCAIWA